MNIEKFTDELLGGEMYHGILSTGMNAYFLPLNADVRVSMFHLFTRFGSIDAKFRVPETGQEVEVEDGTAHFLEHCAFYDPSGKDAMQWFDSKGIMSNAWTFFDHTTYYFHSTGKNIRRNLDFLINFVTIPYFTDAVVAKEQGVIDQEVAMYKDDPDHVLSENLRIALLQSHPFRRSIAGDKKTIMRITKEYLQSAYGTFYHPSNLNLVVFAPSTKSGKDAEKYFRMAEDICSRKGFSQKQAPDYIYSDEPAEPEQKRTVDWHKVAEPQVMIGFKGNMSMKGSAAERLKTDVTNDLVAKVLFSESSEAVYDIVQKGIARGGSFGGYHHSGRGFGMFVAAGAAADCERLIESAVCMIKKQVNGSMSRELFETIKKGCINEGAVRMELENPGNFTSFAIRTLAAGYNPMDAMKSLMSVTYEDVLEAGKRYLDTDNYSVAIMYPKA